MKPAYPSTLIEWLEKAERFISGFEDDTDCNPDVAVWLPDLRAAIAAARAKTAPTPPPRALSDLLAAAIQAEALLAPQTDADEQDHMLDAHDSDTCVLCQLREAIAGAQLEIIPKGQP